ncbi:MAG: SufS family cysteine desulfurase [Pseudomonadales bacterium]|jgi:cysteine desulfurase/selenocysteine lyase|nr:SufS family cysteine desulfurase [Pseudomonadales bacterium]
MFDIRADFPILKRQHQDEPLVYLDSAATTQKPDTVINAVADYYRHSNANVHRAAHKLAEEATTLLEDARTLAQQYIGASDRREVIFTRGTTESINLVAQGLQGYLSEGDEILLTALEHHSNIVPWQMLAQRTGASLKIVAVDANGDLDLADFYQKLSSRTKVFTCNHISNALGTVNPVAELVQAAKDAGAITLIDGAQAILHEQLNVTALDCDFYAFSGHKMYAPTGIGILYGKLARLEALPPYQGGGEMIEHVTFESSTYQQPPYKFEAGTPNIGGAVGLGAAIRYLNDLPLAELVEQEKILINSALSQLRQIPGFRLIGEPKQRSAVISFILEGAHPNDIGTLLDQQGVAVRTGHHCTMPLMARLGVPGTVRASFSLYNNAYDVERLVKAVDKATTFI